MSGSNNPGSPQSLSQSVNLHHKVAAAAVSWEFSLPFSCLVARTGLTSLPFCELVMAMAFPPPAALAANHLLRWLAGRMT